MMACWSKHSKSINILILKVLQVEIWFVKLISLLDFSERVFTDVEVLIYKENFQRINLILVSCSCLFKLCSDLFFSRKKLRERPVSGFSKEQSN
jgi:hypothetical protein